jgi:hypothetical protein
MGYRLRRAGAAVLALLLCLAILPAQAQGPAGLASSIRVKLDGKLINFDVEPTIVSDRVLVPLRRIFEALGATVDYNAATGEIVAVRHWLKVELAVGSAVAVVDGRQVTLQVPPQVVGGRTLVPLRFVSEAMGEKVDWDPATRTVIIEWGTAPRPHRFDFDEVLLRGDELRHRDYELAWDGIFSRRWEGRPGAAYTDLQVNFAIYNRPEEVAERGVCYGGETPHRVPEQPPLWDWAKLCTVNRPERGPTLQLVVGSGDVEYYASVRVLDPALTPADAYPLLAAIIKHEQAAAKAMVMGEPRPAPPAELSDLLSGKRQPARPVIATLEWLLWPDYLGFVGYSDARAENIGEFGGGHRITIGRDSPASGAFRYVSSAAWRFGPFEAPPLTGCRAPSEQDRHPAPPERAEPCTRVRSDGSSEAVLLFSWGDYYAEVTAGTESGSDAREAYPLLRYLADQIATQATALTAGEARPATPALPAVLAGKLEPRLTGTPPVRPLQFAAGNPLPAVVGQPYAFSFCNPPVAKWTDLCGWPGPPINPSGGRPPYFFRLEGGFPPPGLVLLNNGLLQGTPEQAGAGREFSFRVCAKHLSGTSSCQDVIMVVQPQGDPIDRWEGSTWSGTYTVTQGEGAGYRGQVTFRLGNRQAGAGGTTQIPITAAAVVYRDFDFRFVPQGALMRFDAEGRPLELRFSMVEADLPEIVFTVVAAVDKGDTLTTQTIAGGWSTRYNQGTFRADRQ